jgi:hypothetical protein
MTKETDKTADTLLALARQHTLWEEHKSIPIAQDSPKEQKKRKQEEAKKRYHQTLGESLRWEK